MRFIIFFLPISSALFGKDRCTDKHASQIDSALYRLDKLMLWKHFDDFSSNIKPAILHLKETATCKAAGNKSNQLNVEQSSSEILSSVFKCKGTVSEHFAFSPICQRAFSATQNCTEMHPFVHYLGQLLTEDEDVLSLGSIPDMYMRISNFLQSVDFLFLDNMLIYNGRRQEHPQLREKFQKEIKTRNSSKTKKNPSKSQIAPTQNKFSEAQYKGMQLLINKVYDVKNSGNCELIKEIKSQMRVDLISITKLEMEGEGKSFHEPKVNQPGLYEDHPDYIRLRKQYDQENAEEEYARRLGYTR